ncbi:MAG: DNA gyrase subunit A [Promethearchaeota archaeon]
MNGQAQSREIVDEMNQSYLDYSMSVIVGRALPDARDGLKPVQRRVLYTCHQDGFTFNQPHRKCARIVGDCMGKYHPHGDKAIYDTLVRMGQEFSLRYPLIDAQGNFGSIDGDPPAAMRYTEARLARISSELLDDIQKDTVDFDPNFDESLQEPTCLPARLPNLLLNGSQGIAVGMATNIPPYNLTEVCDGIVAVIDRPDILPGQLLDIIKGPDFPTGGVIVGRSGIRSIFTTGRGKLVIRGRYEIELKKKHPRLVLTEIPYQVNKSNLLAHIAKLINSKKIEGISDMRDESSRKGIKIVIDLKKGADPHVIVNMLYKKTQFQQSFGVINLVLVNRGRQPRVLTVLDLIKEYINHRDEVIRRRTKFDLDKARARLHIVEGLFVAIADIENVVDLIKNSKSVEDARVKLEGNYKLTTVQATEILNMRLSRLTALQTSKLSDEKKNLTDDIAEFEDILTNFDRRMKIVRGEVTAIRDKYGDARKTEIIADDSEKDIQKEDLIKEETVMVVLTKDQYIKRMVLSEYRSQRRGGVGKRGIKVHEDDFVLDMCVSSTHDTLVFLTRKGKAFSLRCFEVPQQSRNARGKNVVNLIRLHDDEVISMFAVSDFSQDFYLVMCTEQGLVKKTPLKEFRNIRSTGISAIRLREGDLLGAAKLTTGENSLLIATKDGMAIKFEENEVPTYGRTAQGVKGISLRPGDRVIGLIIVDDDGGDFATITRKGFGKRTHFNRYRAIHRGGKGVINIKFYTPEDEVVDVRKCHAQVDLLIATKQGKIIRIPSTHIRVISRATKGVRLIDLRENDEVVAVASCENNCDTDVAPKVEAGEVHDQEQS